MALKAYAAIAQLHDPQEGLKSRPWPPLAPLGGLCVTGQATFRFPVHFRIGGDL